MRTDRTRRSTTIAAPTSHRGLLRPAVCLAGAAALTLGALTGPVPEADAAPGAPGKPWRDAPQEIGLTGWDTYRHLDRIGELTTGVQTRQFSSFDRTGGNGQDGFDGAFSCLEETEVGCVIAEATGAGEIQSIWFTRDGGDVTANGNIRIELDGRTVLDAPLQDVVDGKLGGVFTFPFVANAEQSSGGVTIKVPMPYRESMRITVDENPQFHHVSYRSFSTDKGVKTFDPKKVPTDVLEAAKSWGGSDPKPEAEKPTTLTAEDLSLAPGESITLGEIAGTGMIDELILDLPALTGAEPAEVITDDGRAFLGSSSFTVAIDPENDGVVLTRRYDPISTDQRAAILVDGEKVAEWTGEAATSGGWVEESVELPASATAGKSEIRVTNEFISAGMDFSEFRYFIDSTVGGERIRTDEVDVGPFETGLASEEAHDYEIVDQQWEGDRVNILPTEMEDEEEVAATDALLEGLRLRVTVDGQQTVDSPVGEFFGTGLGQYDVASLMTAVDADEGRYSSWWPMPVASDARVELVNTSEETLTAGSAEITWAPDASVAERLTAEHPSLGYFRTASHDGEVTEGEDWTFLDVEGQGRFLGVHHTMEGLSPEGNTRGYLEGDERFHVDGLATPQWYGTGTEDLYEGGWYFNRGPFTNPMNGAPAAEAAGMYGCEIQCDAAYRLLIGDAIDFQQGITTGVEPGPESNHAAHYSSTAFWYGHETPAARITDTVEIGDEASEAAHAYSGGGDVREFTSVFEGDHDDVEVTDTVRDADGTVRFTLAIDEDATGVRLVRRADQAEAGQAAEVRIDRKKVGIWSAPLGNEHQRWVEDSFDLPRKVTRGKQEITVEITPLDGAPSWTAARYQALGIGAPEHG